jgi:two-component sensor histidine kinase
VKSLDAQDQIELGRSLLRALRNTGIIVIYQNHALEVLWSQNVPEDWSDTPITGRTDDDFLPPAAVEPLATLKRSVLKTGQPERTELRFDRGTEPRWYDVWIDADSHGDTARGVVTTMVDVTDQKHREQTLRALLREVSHRSKNLLAIILSIATQTGRYSGTIDIFLERFRGRVQSLASSQDLVTSSNWRGATLSQLVQGQAERYCEDVGRSIRLSGVDAHLTPNAALHVGLALHELVVNSISHGALSEPSGHVDLVARLEGTEGGRRLVLEWDENSPSAVPGERRFGSVALERVVPASLEGEAELRVGNGRMRYRLAMPDENFEID